jgi:transposase
MKDIGAWLDELGLAKYSESFRANAIDFDVLSELTDNELKELGMPLGDRKRLLRAIGERADLLARPQPTAQIPSPTGPSAERRQLTVMFADLVDSTALSQSMDAEDLRDLLLGFHKAVSQTVRDGGGFVAKFMGDGVLAYFGYPRASEIAAEQAVRNGTTTLFAALNVATGEVIGECLPRHRAMEFLTFLKTIDRQTPSDLDLHLILDNYATHKAPPIKRWLKRHPRVTLHFTPTSSSWLNLVERLFAEITRQRIRRGGAPRPGNGSQSTPPKRCILTIKFRDTALVVPHARFPKLILWKI